MLVQSSTVKVKPSLPPLMRRVKPLRPTGD